MVSEKFLTSLAARSDVFGDYLLHLVCLHNVVFFVGEARDLSEPVALFPYSAVQPAPSSGGQCISNDHQWQWVTE